MIKLSKNFKEITPTTNETITPIRRGSEKLALSPTLIMSLIPKIKAPNVAGRLSKNENFAASDFFISMLVAAKMVDPLLEMPGNIARP